ncbi:MAG: SCP2 sterol-binding domain-containing protein [Firmicutes bacterium]|nr:SCP2 sterol-binding domain-containing protein [Bacillota bacterium]
MAYFKDAQELYECIGGFFKSVTSNPDMGPKIQDSRLIIQFVYSDPDAVITVDAKNPPPEGHYFRIIEGPTDLVPDVKMSMAADVAHRFWFGKVNLVQALAKGEMKAQGPIPAILKLLPAIKPAYEAYPEYLKSIGKADKLI